MFSVLRSQKGLSRARSFLLGYKDSKRKLYINHPNKFKG